MRKNPLLLSLALAAASLSTAQAQSPSHGSHATSAPAATASTMHVMRAYARATSPGQPAGGGFLTLHNGGTAADRLVAASAPVSASVELHTMKMDGDVMRMRQVDAIDLPVNEKVELKPGGLHLMFIGLKGPLKAGQSFPLTLKFEKAGELTVNVRVEAVGASAKPEAEHKH